MIKLYATNTDSDDLSVVDLEERKEIARIPIGGSPRGSVKFDPAKNFGYVSNCAGNTISVIDLHRDREVAKIQVGLAPRGLAISPDGLYAYVSNSGENSLSIVDLVARKEVKKVSLGANPRHMAYVNSKQTLLVSQYGSDSIASIDFSNGIKGLKVGKVIPVGDNARPYSLTANHVGNLAYVANPQADYMSIIDIVAGKELERVNVGFGGRTVVLSEDEQLAFISTENSNDIAIVGCGSAPHEVLMRVDVGASPRGLALAVKRQELATGCFCRSLSSTGLRNSISIIDISNPSNPKFAASVPVGLGPCSVSILDTEMA